MRAGNGGVSSDQSLFAYLEAHSEGASRIGFVACVIFYGLTAAYGVSAGGQWSYARQAVADAANQAALRAGLEVKAVQVEGQHNLKDAEIDAALGPRDGVSIFAFDTDAARERLKRLGFVGEARVMRLLPSTLVVEIEERKPFALWRDGDKMAAIDEGGKVLALASQRQFPNLPVVSGAGAAAPAKELILALAAVPELRGRVREIERIAGRRWDLVLDTGLRVKLPASDFAPALADLSAIAAKNPGALAEIAELDFRVPSQFTLRLKDATATGRQKFLSWLSDHQESRKQL
ncbi:cell division protein FtsQ/DivIB [Rhodomicrobium sp. R_RK_3]|uniref:cell division protein FtsQ/DivIB n=1 Tax=Rhodomicrobium sp. R_RK_3 TaxID=2029567 RepID=UPI000B4B64B9|nr:cell division protein FtsQ/DivIB [Rhodomicrobium sp. R_RK_3]